MAAAAAGRRSQSLVVAPAAARRSNATLSTLVALWLVGEDFRGSSTLQIGPGPDAAAEQP